MAPKVIDVTDSLSFLTWKTIDEISKETGKTKAQVRKEVKKWIDSGYVIQKGQKYKYDNASDYE